MTNRRLGDVPGEKLDSIGRQHRSCERPGQATPARAPVGSCFCFPNCVRPITWTAEVPLGRVVGPDGVVTGSHPAGGRMLQTMMQKDVQTDRMSLIGGYNA